MMLLDVIDTIDELNSKNLKIGMWGFNGVHVMGKDNLTIWFNYGGVRRRKEFKFHEPTSDALDWIEETEPFLRNELLKMEFFGYKQNSYYCYMTERSNYYVEVYSFIDPLVIKRRSIDGVMIDSRTYDGMEVIDAMKDFEKNFCMSDFQLMTPSLRDEILKHEAT